MPNRGSRPGSSFCCYFSYGTIANDLWAFPQAFNWHFHENWSTGHVSRTGQLVMFPRLCPVFSPNPLSFWSALKMWSLANSNVLNMHKVWLSVNQILATNEVKCINCDFCFRLGRNPRSRCWCKLKTILCNLRTLELSITCPCGLWPL